jgi:hypothetical protein
MPMNERQIKLLNKILDGFDGKLTSSKWASIGKCSQDTALRDISDLLEAFRYLALIIRIMELIKRLEAHLFLILQNLE